MTKKMNKKIAMFLAAVTAATTIFAGAAMAEENAKVYAEGDPLKFAYIGWGFNDETSLMYLREFDLISSLYNVEYTLSDAWGTSASAEDVVEVLPSLIEAGCQGIIIHSMSAKIVEICNENQVYFTLSGETILDEELLAMCEASPYYVGTVALADYDGGKALGEFITGKGATKIGLSQIETRNLETNRANGVKDSVEAAGAEIVTSYLGKEQAPAIRDMMANYPEIDGIALSNGTNGMLDNVAVTLQALGKSEDVALATICSPVGYGEWLDAGIVDMIMAGEAFEPFVCSMLLINAMYGHKVDETPINMKVPYFPVTTSEEVDLYSEFFGSEAGGLPITAEQVPQWDKTTNPDLNNEWILNWFETEYNVQAMQAARQ